MPCSKASRCCDWKPGFTNWKRLAYMNASALSAFRHLVTTKRIRSVSFLKSAWFERILGPRSGLQVRFRPGAEWLRGEKGPGQFCHQGVIIRHLTQRVSVSKILFVQLP